MVNDFPDSIKRRFVVMVLSAVLYYLILLLDLYLQSRLYTADMVSSSIHHRKGALSAHIERVDHSVGEDCTGCTGHGALPWRQLRLLRHCLWMLAWSELEGMCLLATRPPSIGQETTGVVT